MQTRVVRHGDAATFLRHARDWLLLTEAENALVLGIADSADETSDDLYAATVEQGGAVVGCALRTPPRKLLLTRVPPGAIDALVVDVAACYDDLPGVLGPPSSAREFARLWCERRGGSVSERMSLRLHALERVIPPDPQPPGMLRLATSHDLGLVTSWVACFHAEAHVEAAGRDLIAERVAAGEIALWCVDDEPRTMAGYSGRSPNGVRIGYVYTPPEWRRRGYATACTAALTQHALDSGARFCCLYTDLANPVSNAIYRRIGYFPVADAIDLQLDRTGQ